MRRYDPDTLAALESNARDAERTEREQVHACASPTSPVLYCHGRGWPVIALCSVEDYDNRARLSRDAARN
jgi:hypothetical protein